MQREVCCVHRSSPSLFRARRWTSTGKDWTARTKCFLMRPAEPLLSVPWAVLASISSWAGYGGHVDTARSSIMRLVALLYSLLTLHLMACDAPEACRFTLDFSLDAGTSSVADSVYCCTQMIGDFSSNVCGPLERPYTSVPGCTPTTSDCTCSCQRSRPLEF